MQRAPRQCGGPTSPVFTRCGTITVFFCELQKRQKHRKRRKHVKKQNTSHSLAPRISQYGESDVDMNARSVIGHPGCLSFSTRATKSRELAHFCEGSQDSSNYNRILQISKMLKNLGLFGVPFSTTYAGKRKGQLWFPLSHFS